MVVTTMQWDGKWFLLTLVAILIFFTIGIQVGIAVRQERVAQSLFERMENQLKRYREETARLLTERDRRIQQLEETLRQGSRLMETSQTLLSNLLPVALKGRLLYRNIALVTTAEDFDRNVVVRIQRGLQSVGATVPVTVRWHPNSFCQATPSDLLELVGNGPQNREGRDQESIRKEILGRFAHQLRWGGGDDWFRRLARKGWLEYEGTVSAPTGSAVVIVAFQRERDMNLLSSLDQPLIQAMISAGLKVVLGESLSLARAEIVSGISRDGAPTIDHLDTALGLWSLVGALCGEPGDLGLRNSSKRPVPDLAKLIGQ